MELKSKYKLDNFIDYLKSNLNFKRISIQFNDKDLELSIELVSKLKTVFPDRSFYIVAETSYGACCADEVAAQHVNSDLILRVGESCLTQTQNLPVYFLCENIELNQDSLVLFLNEQLKNLELNKRIFIFYRVEYEDAFLRVRNIIDNENIKISLLPTNPDNLKTEVNSIYNRLFKKEDNIEKGDIIIYFGMEDNKILIDLCLNYLSTNTIYLKTSLNDKTEQMSVTKINTILRKRFNLIEKAKESEVFGIIVGSLSIKNINTILDKTKALIKANNKKVYIFLLGKITMEKLSNFVDFIDCFILLACPQCSNNDLKALMKPIINPIDLFLAYDENFQWDNSYSFDNENLIKKIKDLKIKEKEFKPDSDGIDLNKKVENMQISELKNQAVSKVFNLKMINYFDERKFKGLEASKEEPIKKYQIGRTGLPIKYEEIKNE